MRYLLDTHTLLWFLQDARDLPSSVADRIEAEDADNHVSIASIWEMAIKLSLGMLRVPYSLDGDLPRLLDQNAFGLLPVQLSHLQVLTELPFHHRDPFDRLIISQATVESMPICTGDGQFEDYGVRILW